MVEAFCFSNLKPRKRMLSAPIDHNREPEPEKHISKIRSPYWTLPTDGGLGAPKTSHPHHVSEGVILRVRDTRLMERRTHTGPHPLENERRHRDNRQSSSRWNTTSHHILVIALERKAGEPEPWKTGDRVSVTPKTQIEPPQTQPPAEPPPNKPPLLIKDEGDYVLHLSTHYPYER
ncbi:MAG: hypothetical protein HOH38_08890 [Nitrospinaceae bacterium]|nr:hypothetical protein [Nitrospinaceae bacterium]